MRAIWTSLSNQTRSRATVSAALLSGMMCLSGAVWAQAPSVPAAVMSQVLGPSAIGTGSALAGSNVAGTSMGVNSFGDLFYSDTYGNHIYEFPASSWTQSPVPAATVLASVSNLNAGGVAVDKNNNLYINFAYNGYVLKVPYTPGAGGADGTYATITAPDGSTPACTGSDTAECLETNANPSGSDSVAMVFDAQGDLFITTRDTGTTPNAIYECPATSCLDGGTTAATMIYQEPTAGVAASQLWLGDVAVDAAGNVFFTDSVISDSGSNTSTSSNLKEISYTAGSGYASTPTTIYTYTPATPGGYDSEITAVAAGPNNIIYMFQLGGGVLAFHDNAGVLTNGYVVSTATAKAGAVDAQGNLYVEFNFNNTEVMSKVVLNPLTAPTPASASASSTASFTTILNDGTSCPTVTYSFSGSSAGAFSATTDSAVNCGSTAIAGGTPGTGVTIASGSSLGGTLTFTPSIGGISSAVMTATDSSGNSGAANVAGSATGTLATPTFNPPAGAYGSVQTVTISSASGGAPIFYTTDGTTPSSSSTPYTAPITVGNSETLSAIAIEAGNTTSGVGTAAYTINTAPTGPPDFSVAAGTYTSPQTVTITSSTPGAVIYYTTDGSNPTTSSAVYSGPLTVSSTETITAYAQAPGAIASSDVQAAYTISLPPSVLQNVVISQTTALPKLTAGGAESGGEPAGDTMAVDSEGNVIMGNTYGNQVLLYPASGAAPTVLGTASNTAGVALDAHQNLFIAFTYGPIVKIPYTGNETWAAIGAAQPSNGPPYPVGTPNCTGNDTAECIVASASQGGNTSVLFDAAGDMFYGTSAANGTNPNAIFKVPAATLYTSTSAGTPIFQEPTSSSGTTTGQLEIGGMAVDASGNVFFTDSAINTGVGQESFSSNVNELPVSSSGTTGYASAPAVIYTYTVPTPAQYDAEIDGVAVGANGTLYALVQNTIGLLAFPSNNGAYSSSTAYLVSPVTGKLLAMDQQGNFFIEGYTNAAGADALTYVAVNNIAATAGPTATTMTATNLVTVLNDGATSVTSFAASGTNAAAFSATSGTCTGAGLNSQQCPTTLSFAPTVPGINMATLTATDASSNTGSATVMGNATGTLPAPTFSPAAGTYTTIQTVSIMDAADGVQIYYTTDGSTPNTTAGGSTMLYAGPISVIQNETINAIAVEAGDTTSSQASAAYTLTIPATLAPAASVPSGTYGLPQVITLSDATPDALIYYTTDGSPATSSSPLYTTGTAIPVTSGTMTINALATSPGAADSAMATYTYTISLAPSAYQAVVINQQTQLGTLPSSGGAQSGQEPAGDTIAINSLGNVLLGDTYGGNLFQFTPQGTKTTLGSLSNVEGTAVDSQNNLYIGWAYSGSLIVKLPYVSGAYVPLTPQTGSTPACTGNDTVECTIGTLNTGGASVVSMLFDPAGDLIYATANATGGGGTNNTIFKMPAAALYSGGTTPTVLYSEPVSSSPTTTGQLAIGGMALDSAGDLFFTDSAINSTSASNQESFSSNVNELPLSSGSSTGYASTPTVLYTHTPTTPGNYDDEIDGVAVAPNGTVYFIVQNMTGILAIPQSGGTYDSSQIYLASSVSGKLLSGDAFGNMYAVDGSGNIFAITVGNITVPGTQVATPASTATNVYTITNDTGCSGSPAVTFAASGTDASAFSAATTGSCSAVGLSSGQFATTVTFSPGTAGGNAAVLTATDGNGGTGTAEVSAVATPATQAAAPTFTPPAGTYASAQSVTLATTTPNASIYYTVDGTTPGTTAGGSTLLYSGPITVSTSETIQAIAAAQNVASSTVASAAYVLPAATPTFSPGPGTYTSVQQVTIASTTPGALIFYTLDGTTPQTSAGGSTLAYSGPITVGASETVNAIATAPSFSASPMASAVYAINLPAAATPTFSVQAGTYTSVQAVSLSDATAGATIYYTVDGTTPSTTGAGSTMTYTGPISVGTSETVNAIAVASGYSPSALATAIYAINLPGPAMTLTSSQTTINVGNGGTGTATITLTTNSTFPNVVKDSNGNVTSGGISLTCSGYLTPGLTCSLNPATLAPGPGATATSTVTISSSTASATTPALRARPGVLFAGTMLAGVLALFGLRKRRWMQITLMLALSIGSFGMLSGCGSTPKATGPTTSQIVVTATTVLPDNSKVISTIPFIVSTQQ